MSSYLGPIPNIPTLPNVNILAEDQQPLRNQVDDLYQNISFIMNDKKRRDQYLQIEDITIDTWVDGKAIFRKTIATGAIANGGTTNIPHGISNLDTLVNIRVMVSNGSNQRLLGYASPTAANAASVDTDSTNVVIVTGASFGANYDGYVIMEYTRS